MLLPSYNPAAMSRPRPTGRLLCWILTALSALVLAGLAASCDYPEQGFFVLSALDADGQVVSKHLFEIQELVDDTDLTTGFVIHLYDPAHKRVLDLPFDNAPEKTRRGWLFNLSDADYGQGDLALDFTHDEQLTFVGAWRGPASRHPYPLAGSVEATDEDKPSVIELDSPLPSGASAAGHAIASFRVEEITPAQAAKLLGAKPASYKHVKGSVPIALDPDLGRSVETAHRGGAVSQAGTENVTPPPMAHSRPVLPLGGQGKP